MTSNISIEYDAKKKNGFAAAIMNALIPGVGYFYCGMPIIGTIVFVFSVGLILNTLGLAWFIIAPVVFIDGMLAAGRANKRLASKLNARESF